MGFCLASKDSGFSFNYLPGQRKAEFFINHPLNLGKQLPDQNDGEVMHRTTTPWQMYFDGSSTQGGAGAGIVFISPNGLVSHHSYRLFFPCTNNVADYEALLIGFKLAAAMGMRSIHVNKGDSQLVVRQVIAEYQVIEAKQQPYTKSRLDSHSY